MNKHLLALISLCYPIFACPTGSIQGLDSNTCYRFISDKLNWYDAERTCTTYGGHLTSISSSLENSFVSNKAGSLFNNGQNFWLGSNNLLVRFNWTWSDVTNFTYTNWAKGEPNQNTTQAFYCLSFNSSTGNWKPDTCVNNKSFVCKVPKNGPPCQTNWTFYAATNSCYKLVNGSNFTDVSNQCMGQGGNLASIHNALQGAVVSSFSSSYSRFYTWIGLYYPINNYWGWTDGTRLDYTNWATGEPTNQRGYQCVKIQTADNWTHTWTTGLCDQFSYYKDAVCVQDPLF